MPNMSYCQFENTYNDLLQCYETLGRYYDIDEAIEDTNERDGKYIMKLISLCEDIICDFT